MTVVNGWPVQCSTCQAGRWQGFKIECRKFDRLFAPLYNKCKEWIELDRKEQPR